jgi:hypothetical protein
MTLSRPRYTDQPLPPYTYVPGRSPHPVSDPKGHMYGHNPAQPPPLDPTNWQHSEVYLYGIDLFNHGFYWEAHEAWESLWHAAGRTGIVADFLKGLIKLAAAGVKSLEENSTGVARHCNRAIDLLRSISTGQDYFCGIDLEYTIAEVNNGIDRETCLILYSREQNN